MILEQLQKIWSQSGAWPGLIQAMRAITPGYNPKTSSSSQLLAMWSDFPGLVSAAAGGKSEWAENLALAWMVFYEAAAIMDTIEDGDPPGAEWAHLTPGMIVNAASGLFFSASLALNRISQEDATKDVASEVIDQIYRGFLIMCGGQQRDLNTPRPSIKDYWQIAAEKSGVFFGTVCRCAARLGTNDAQQLQGYYQYGLGIGLLLQMLDDVDDVQKLPAQGRWQELFHCLPVIYALRSGQPEKRKRLDELLMTAPKAQDGENELVDLIDSSGAVNFLIDEFTNRRKQALTGLEQACPRPGFKTQLAKYLPELKFK